MAVEVVALLNALGAENVRTEGGRSVWCSCPLGTHSDSDPSFEMVSAPGEREHGYWRCYGCHEGGGFIRLVRLVLKLEGARDGAKVRAFIARVEKEGGAAARGPLVDELRVQATLTRYPRSFSPKDAWETKPLGDWPGSLRSYVLGRGISAEQVERWKIGYAVHGRLAGRIVFPIFDGAGRLVSYSARTAIGDRERYLTPHRSENPSPSAIFGEQFWPPIYQREASVCIVVEGAINALAVEKAVGLSGADVFVAALGGSNDSPFQFVPLMGFGRLVVLSDPDAAGDRLAEALELSGGPESTRVRLPTGEDAASLGFKFPELLRRKIVDAILPPRILTGGKDRLGERAPGKSEG